MFFCEVLQCYDFFSRCFLVLIIFIICCKGRSVFLDIIFFTVLRKFSNGKQEIFSKLPNLLASSAYCERTWTL